MIPAPFSHPGVVMFTFAKLLFRVELDGPVNNRYALFAMRRFFPDLFCGHPSISLHREAREKIFSQPLTQDPSALRRFQKPPLPFAFTLPILPLNHKDPFYCEIGLALAGSALNYCDCFIKGVVSSVRQLGVEHGFNAEIASISSVALDGTSLPISPEKTVLTLLSGDNFLSTGRGPAETVSMTLLTPLHLIHNGKPLRRITFPEFIRPLMRKISSLSYYYGGSELDMDFKSMAEESFKVSVEGDQLEWEAWSGVGAGVIGKLVFCGPLQEYLPFLMMGELFHLGKKAAYGLGAYRLTTVHEP